MGAPPLGVAEAQSEAPAEAVAAEAVTVAVEEWEGGATEGVPLKEEAGEVVPPPRGGVGEGGAEGVAPRSDDEAGGEGEGAARVGDHCALAEGLCEPEGEPLPVRVAEGAGVPEGAPEEVRDVEAHTLGAREEEGKGEPDSVGRRGEGGAEEGEVDAVGVRPPPLLVGAPVAVAAVAEGERDAPPLRDAEGEGEALPEGAPLREGGGEDAGEGDVEGLREGSGESEGDRVGAPEALGEGVAAADTEGEGEPMEVALRRALADALGERRADAVPLALVGEALPLPLAQGEGVGERRALTEGGEDPEALRVPPPPGGEGDPETQRVGSGEGVPPPAAAVGEVGGEVVGDVVELREGTTLREVVGDVVELREGTTLMEAHREALGEGVPVGVGGAEGVPAAAPAGLPEGEPLARAEGEPPGGGAVEVPQPEGTSVGVAAS